MLYVKMAAGGDELTDRFVNKWPSRCRKVSQYFGCYSVAIYGDVRILKTFRINFVTGTGHQWIPLTNTQ